MPTIAPVRQRAQLQDRDRRQVQEHDLYALFGVAVPRTETRDTRIGPRSSSFKDAQKIELQKHEKENSSSFRTTEFEKSPASPEITNALTSLKDEDVMDQPHVLQRCIRVNGSGSQSHIIKVQGITDAKRVRALVGKKFNVSSAGFELQVVNPVDKGYLLVDDDWLINICMNPDDENRRGLWLKLVSAPPEDMEGTEGPPGGSKVNTNIIQNFFRSVKSTTADGKPKKSNRLRAFFGERAPDALIADQLDSFFPNLKKDIVSPGSSIHSIQNIMKQNIKSRPTSIISRRKTMLSPAAKTTSITYAPMKPPALTILKESIAENLKDASEPSPLVAFVDTPQKQSILISDPIPELAQASLGDSEPRVETTSHQIRWEQGKMIGQGAFGKVFHGLDLDTGVIMAVKQVPLGTDRSGMRQKQVDALKREIDLLKDLENINIVQYLGYEATSTEINVFLEYVSGGSISSVLAQTGKFDRVYCQDFAAQILCGLDYLHQRMIIHRDIKVLIDTNGIVKITDFGISKKNGIWMSMQGTINWMAPEIARGKGYSAKVDIWALGCLVLEMLTGHNPWHKIRGNIIYLLGTGHSPPVPDTLETISLDFLKLCFTIDPDARPTAIDLLEDLFADIDGSENDFTEWARMASHNRAEEGDSEEDEESSEDEDDDEIED